MASGSDLHEEAESRRSLLPSGVLHKRLKSEQAEMTNKSLLKIYFVLLFSLGKIILDKEAPGCTNFSLFSAFSHLIARTFPTKR